MKKIVPEIGIIVLGAGMLGISGCSTDRGAQEADLDIGLV